MGRANRRRFTKVGDLVSVFQIGKRYYVNYTHNKKQYRSSLGTTNSKEAKRRALKIEADIITGKWSAKPTDITIADAVAMYDAYLVADRRASKTITKYRGVYARVMELSEQRGTLRLNQLDHAFLDAFRSQLSKAGRAETTIYHQSVIVKQLTKFAFSRNELITDPLKGYKLKKPKPSPQPCWTSEEVGAILRWVQGDPYLFPAFTLLAETGMRFAELQYLTWEDVDLVRGVIHVRPKDGWNPKTGDVRTIPISDALSALLREMSRTYRWVVTAPPTKARPMAGRQLEERWLLKRLKKTLRSLKFPGHLHTFRHYFISDALLKGIPVAIVRAWAGHVDRRIIDLYTHVHDTASRDAMDRLSAAKRKTGIFGDGLECKAAGD